MGSENIAPNAAYRFITAVFCELIRPSSRLNPRSAVTWQALAYNDMAAPAMRYF